MTFAFEDLVNRHALLWLWIWRKVKGIIPKKSSNSGLYRAGLCMNQSLW